jgi:hypothetical protein
MIAELRNQVYEDFLAFMPSPVEVIKYISVHPKISTEFGSLCLSLDKLETPFVDLDGFLDILSSEYSHAALERVPCNPIVRIARYGSGAYRRIDVPRLVSVVQLYRLLNVS